MANDVISALGDAAWYLTGALLVVLAFRMPTRRWFGPQVAYKTWLLVPAVMAAALVPLPAAPRIIEAANFQFGQLPVPSFAAPVAEQPALLVFVWLAGALSLAAWFWRSHRAFLGHLGGLTFHEGIYLSDGSFAGAALLGVWRPQVVVPADFCARYTPAEQRLIICHEQVHANRGDPWSNLLQAVLQCIFWFNPLVHLAVLLFRTDQELACDAAVIGANPTQRRAYATALLKSQDVAIATAVNVACHWRSTHPMKERIMSMQELPPNNLRRLAGRIAIGALILTSTGLALASREDGQAAAGATRYVLETTFQVAGKSFAPRFRVGDGESIKVRVDRDGKPLTAEFQIRRTDASNTVLIKARIDSGTMTIAQPTVLNLLGQPARIRIDTEEGPLDVSLLVTEVL